VNRYLEESPASINSDPLEWWATVGSRYPKLKTLACKYLAIPATSVPSERIFSKSGEIVSRRRASLKPSTVDMLVFLCANVPLLQNDNLGSGKPAVTVTQPATGKSMSACDD